MNLDGEITYRPPTSRTVTWYEVTGIYLGAKALDAATGDVVGKVVDAVFARAVSWAKNRLARGAGVDQHVVLYGPDGTILKEVRVREDVHGDHSNRASP